MCLKREMLFSSKCFFQYEAANQRERRLFFMACYILRVANVMKNGCQVLLFLKAFRRFVCFSDSYKLLSENGRKSRVFYNVHLAFIRNGIEIDDRIACGLEVTLLLQNVKNHCSSDNLLTFAFMHCI